MENWFLNTREAQQPRLYDNQQPIDKNSKHINHVICLLLFMKKKIIMNQLLILDFSLEAFNGTKLRVRVK